MRPPLPSPPSPHPPNSLPFMPLELASQLGLLTSTDMIFRGGNLSGLDFREADLSGTPTLTRAHE